VPKSIADKTSQLSVRVPDEEMVRIDKIRDRMEVTTSIKPQRSDVVRMVLGLGIDEYEQRELRKESGKDIKEKEVPKEAPKKKKGAA
jgi:phosphotransferase system IIB component